jgi:hypothetical protein
MTVEYSEMWRVTEIGMSTRGPAPGISIEERRHEFVAKGLKDVVAERVVEAWYRRTG